jgi:hypothetical protein
MWVLEGSIGVPPVKLAQIGPKEPGFRQARRLSYSFRNSLQQEAKSSAAVVGLFASAATKGKNRGVGCRGLVAILLLVP